MLDTNVLVSGLLSPFGPPGEIVRLVSDGSITLCLDARIIAEYEDVLARPRFGFDQDDVAALLDLIDATGEMTAAGPLPVRLPDLYDEPFLEVAIATSADCLVTGNIAHFPQEGRGGAVVLSPAEFMGVYRAGTRTGDT
ncbi:MAG: putative toxin-antitoxin system toxin component, PIN family [Actinomycetia bacterium]|nr:putative toxin-antitoxin system toxin component, PIN family [Actinomycetes bacterium]